MSARNCISQSFATMPPSTRSAVARDAAVIGHGLHQVAGLVADRLEGGADDLGDARIAGKAENGAAGVGSQ